MRIRSLAPMLAVVLLAAGAAAQEGAQAPAKPTPTEEAHALLARIEQLRSDYRDRYADGRALEGNERNVVMLQARKRLLEFLRAVDELVALVARQEAEGDVSTKTVEATRALLWDIDRRLFPFVDELESTLTDLRGKIGAEGVDPEANRTEIEANEDLLDDVVRFSLDHLEHLDQLGLSTKRAREKTAAMLAARADDLAGRLELIRQRLEEAQAKQDLQKDAASDEAVRDVRLALDRQASSLWTTCDMMEELDLQTAECRKVLIKTTGEISTDVFDWEVLAGLAGDAAETARRWIERRGPPLLGEAAIFVGIVAIFWLTGRIARHSAERFIDRSSASELARRMLVRMVSRTFIVIGIFVALSQVGINVTALLAGLGIAGFIIGFALQETLGNFAAGAMILMYRPYDVGDVIEAGGVYGTVDNMNLVSTTFLTFDNQTLVVPNSKIWGNVIRNVTEQRIRRVDLTFFFAHGTQLEPAEEILMNLCREHPKVLDDPPPAVLVQQVTQTAMVIAVRPWVNTEDYWTTFWELNRQATTRLSEAGIAIGTQFPDFASPLPRA